MEILEQPKRPGPGRKTNVEREANKNASNNGIMPSTVRTVSTKEQFEAINPAKRPYHRKNVDVKDRQPATQEPKSVLQKRNAKAEAEITAEYGLKKDGTPAMKRGRKAKTEAVEGINSVQAKASTPVIDLPTQKNTEISKGSKFNKDGSVTKQRGPKPKQAIVESISEVIPNQEVETKAIETYHQAQVVKHPLEDKKEMLAYLHNVDKTINHIATEIDQLRSEREAIKAKMASRNLGETRYLNQVFGELNKKKRKGKRELA